MKVNRKRFERLADKLTKVSHGRYHINRSIGIDKVGTIYYTRWCIFDRLDDGPLYFSPDNKPVLASAYGDDLRDIKVLIKKEKRRNRNEFIQSFIPRK